MSSLTFTGEHFPLNDCVQRRLIVWNEPSIMPSAYDTIKMLTGGDPCPANVKYQGHSVIARTPVIFTSNKNCFPNTEVWKQRIFFEKWQSCPELKAIKKYPNPRTYASLMTQCEIA